MQFKGMSPVIVKGRLAGVFGVLGGLLGSVLPRVSLIWNNPEGNIVWIGSDTSTLQWTGREADTSQGA